MITLKYKMINDSGFFEAMEVLDKCQSLTIGTALAFNKIRKAVVEETKSAQEMFKKLVDKHAVMETITENGKIVSRPKRENGDFVMRDKAAFDAEVEELLESDFKVNIPKIPVSALTNAQLSPQQLRALDAIIEVEQCPKLSVVNKAKGKK